ncbi:uncharacterized protein LOC131682752 [Topomyia yanbarensis]|uniref:uncharacterized protein LOC131682752 n=1 Tax=Topomyia yanbarensis TaxID=2498891 RepID=UPI00273C9796|nr:uncharacterized protein LOC131682752 [Topomyia yanbarensis]
MHTNHNQSSANSSRVHYFEMANSGKYVRAPFESELVATDLHDDEGSEMSDSGTISADDLKMDQSDKSNDIDMQTGIADEDNSIPTGTNAVEGNTGQYDGQSTAPSHSLTGDISKNIGDRVDRLENAIVNLCEAMLEQHRQTATKDDKDTWENCFHEPETGQADRSLSAYPPTSSERRGIDIWKHSK